MRLLSEDTELFVEAWFELRQRLSSWHSHPRHIAGDFFACLFEVLLHSTLLEDCLEPFLYSNAAIYSSLYGDKDFEIVRIINNKLMLWRHNTSRLLRDYSCCAYFLDSILFYF